MPLTYGIEIEAILPRGVSLEACAIAIDAVDGVGCYYASYSHSVEHQKWKVVTDGSLSATGIPGGNCAEIVSPVLKEEDLGQVNKVCEVLEALGAKVNRSCGLHVHIGARHLSVGAMRKLAELYVANEDIIDGLLPPSRRGNGNTYLRSMKSNTNLTQLATASDVQGIAQAINRSERYVKLNFTPFWRQGTVEFRHHSGTIDPVKILRWVSLCSKLIAVAEKDGSIPVALPVGTPPVMGGYWRSGRRTRAIYEMLTRPEGATSEELRFRLEVKSRPNIRWHLERAGVAAAEVSRRRERRGGYEVFKLENDAPVASAVAATLDGLLTKLEMSAEEVAFWKERATLVQPETGPAAVMSNTMRRTAAGPAGTSPTARASAARVHAARAARASEREAREREHHEMRRIMMEESDPLIGLDGTVIPRRRGD